ncbi:DUF421 domain-containing protein [Leisingera aquaemixtae]|uniref:DUF421 domain-containing protein n=1 Tax=Leisingera aquaemixtae TaxID=1396826 RepID=UPI0021A9200F|nr:YetF domain-containing protein [Leisingera aquaemixtae]UWQ24376.1 DUF421 domain-containing protein [Leisingera aquaemixtae]UWQ36918.1 DUF421 domain-containing protein [Leisingera aquaemixtae]
MFLSTEIADILARALVLSSLAVFWVIVVVRFVGLRAFSKMTAFDFVITVATGSLLAGASQASSWSGFFQPVLAISVLLSVQYAVSILRRKSDRFEKVVQNTPVLLMRDGVILYHALKTTRVAENDLAAKLREANVLDLSEVRAVVLETTGDISVLHGVSLAPWLLNDVRTVD